MTLKVADRPPLVLWQLEQLEGECALLQGHAADPSCPCETDTEHCVRKHLLTIEALAKETYAMLDDDQEKEIVADLADQARVWRKRVEQISLESSPADNPTPQPIRAEQHNGHQTQIFKETTEFHAGSFRTIKPREDLLAVIGCPIDTTDWINEECICRATGERGCTEIHSLNEPIIPFGGE
ncbi:unnamed protein product [marine sediment metagenome]|uniref:Uncharacterized protein n=1 Tax=marine sediment metagenome TaxID=412755 RepID=X1SB75_9ZZZZ